MSRLILIFSFNFSRHFAGVNGADNSYYDRLLQRLSFGEGGVDDGEDADVIIHELTHGVHHWLTLDGFSMHEGIAEVSHS